MAYWYIADLKGYKFVKEMQILLFSALQGEYSNK